MRPSTSCTREGGRYFGLHLHPWLFGMPYRTRYLDAALARLARHENVWQATAGDGREACFERADAEPEPHEPRIMSRKVAGTEIERLIQLLARLPGLGPRSARKAALMLLKRRVDLLQPLAAALADAAEKIVTCAHVRQHRYDVAVHDLPGPAAQ